MAMLTFDDLAEDLVGRYAKFISALTHYEIYCAYNIGHNKLDYLSGFQNLLLSYEYLWDDEGQKPKKWYLEPITDLFNSIRTILNAQHITNEDTTQISLLIKSFQHNHEHSFRKNYVLAQVKEEIQHHYSPGLYETVADLLKNENTDEAVISAFKFLDNHLQKLLNVTPYQYYGEELINYAFSAKNGLLQLDTNPNEQLGLRNFFSGANAIFRNPIAHRFIKHNLFFAASVIVIVNTMAEMATQISNKKYK